MDHPELPRFPTRLLRWFCKEEQLDEIEGDLYEAYHQRYAQSPKKAKWKYYKEVLLSFKTRNIGIMQRYNDTRIGLSLSILRQYLFVMLRTIRRSKMHSGISIASLALGLTCAGLIALYLQKELTYDKMYSNADNIYRISHLSHNSGRSYGFAPVGMVPHLIETMDAVSDGTRIFKYRRAIPITVEKPRVSFNEPRFGWADPSFFQLFDLQIVAGSDQGLKRPNVVMINETTAKKYFGDHDPIGQLLVFNWSEETKLEVVGVFEDFPSNTSFQLDLISNIETCKHTMWSGDWFTDWKNMFTSAYVVIKPGEVESVLNQAQTATSTFFTPEKPKAWETSIQKLTDLHLATPLDVGEWSPHNDVQSIFLFASIGLIILCLGCFNFINIITAQASQRAKEIGVRKVLGSRKQQIAQQTLFETLCFVAIAGLISSITIYLLLPALANLTNHLYTISDLIAFDFILGFLGVLLIVALLAGAYPALYISRITSLQLMKKNSLGARGSNVRNSLVTIQFIISAGLVICTLMVLLQMKFIREKNLGFDDSMIVTFPIHNDEAVIPKINAFRNELSGYQGIGAVTAASHEMLSDYTYITNFIIQGYDDQMKWERYTVEQNYLKTFDLEVIAGRGFDISIASDSTAFVLNESAVQALNLTPEEAVGLTITDQGLDYEGRIIGVVKNFHFRSLHHEIQPFVMYVNWDRLDYISAKLETRNFQENIAVLEEKWNDIFGDSVPFFYDFLDQRTGELYENEANQSVLFSAFSIVSIFLGMLGLFGSALFTTERRFKEIGMRKVLGANTIDLITMINSKFIKMISIAFLIASPLAYILMRNWLDEFAYRITQPVWVYLLTAIASIAIAGITVSYLSWKAATSNPVEALKVE